MTKTLQLHNQAKLLHLPRLNNELWPVRALKKCLELVPQDNNAPLFQFKLYNKWILMN